MKYTLLLVLMIGALLLGACGGEPEPTTQESPLEPGIANPASTFCTEKGNTLEIRTQADGGQVGYCVFPDGTECEEWAYYRGECAPGTPKP